MIREPLCYAGEYGYDIVIQTGYDATGVSSAAMIFKGPDGTEYTKTATAVGGAPANGNFYWTVTAGFFTKGEWQVQVKLTFATKILYSERKRFSVGLEIA